MHKLLIICFSLLLFSCANSLGYSWAPQNSHEYGNFAVKVTDYSELKTDGGTHKGESMNIETGERYLQGNVHPTDLLNIIEALMKRDLLQDCKKYTGGECVLTRYMDEVYFENHDAVIKADKTSTDFLQHTWWRYQPPKPTGPSPLMKTISSLDELLVAVVDIALDVAIELGPAYYCNQTKENYLKAKSLRDRGATDFKWRNMQTIKSNIYQDWDNQKRQEKWVTEFNARSKMNNGQRYMNKYKEQYYRTTPFSSNQNCADITGILN